jgi:glycosyltransferase involved in cell wall biosynthesis
MASPRVSVIIPVYNGEDTLGAAIESVLDQSFEDLEIIVVNDGSTDGSAQVVADYPQVRVIHQQNRGLNPARAQGAENAIGEYLTFLDADDEFHPSKIELQVSILDKAPDIAALFCAPCIVKQNKRYCRSQDISGRIRPETFQQFLVGRPEGHPVSVLMRRELLKQAGGVYRLGFVSGERDLWLRALSQGHRICTLQLPLYYYHKREGSLSTKHADELERVVKYLQVWCDQSPRTSEFMSPEIRRRVWKASLSHCIEWFVKYRDKESAERAWTLLNERASPSLRVRAVYALPGMARTYAKAREAVSELYRNRVYERFSRKLGRDPGNARRLVAWEDLNRLSRERLVLTNFFGPGGVGGPTVSGCRGRVVYQCKRSFRDGSAHVVLEPLDFIARLAAVVPRYPAASIVSTQSHVQPPRIPT